MGDDLETARALPDRPAVTVERIRLASAAHVGRPVAFQGRGWQDPSVHERQPPAQHVPRRAVNLAVGTQLPVGAVEVPGTLQYGAPALAADVAPGQPLVFPGHQEVAGLEQALGQEEPPSQQLLVAGTAHLLQNGAEQTVAGVGVGVAPARREFEGLLQGAPNQLLATDRVPVGTAFEIDDARRVGEQVVKGDGALVAGHVVEELGDRIPDAQQTLCLE